MALYISGARISVVWPLKKVKPRSQNRDTKKVDSAKKYNSCYAMIHHQNADAMVLDQRS
jgi:hypothetical protein